MTKFILVFAVLGSETKVKHFRNNNKQLLLLSPTVVVVVVAFVLTGQTVVERGGEGSFLFRRKMSD